MKQLLTVFTITTFLLAMVCSLNAQITINADDMNFTPGIVTTRQESDGPIEIDLGESGANRSWDFSGIEVDSSGPTYVLEPEGLPGADQFEDATIAYYQETPELEMTFYVFANANEDFVDALGMGVEMQGQIFAIPMEIEGHQFNFPFSYGYEWDYVLTNNFGGELGIDSIHSVVDAWGTITDLAGEFQCLRVFEFKRETDLHEDEEDEVQDSWRYYWIAQNFGQIVEFKSEEGPDFQQGDFARVTNVGMNGVAHRTNPAIPAVSGLNPAFPNPFNPQTQLQFNVSQPGMVVINVYDPSGRIVSNVINGFYAPGNYQTTFNAVNLSSGTYFAKFNANNVTQTQRLLLTK